MFFVPQQGCRIQVFKLFNRHMHGLEEEDVRFSREFLERILQTQP
jgi:hypothetical protein